MSSIDDTLFSELSAFGGVLNDKICKALIDAGYNGGSLMDLIGNGKADGFALMSTQSQTDALASYFFITAGTSSGGDPFQLIWGSGNNMVWSAGNNMTWGS